MKLLFKGQMPKDPSFPDAIEDVVESAIEVGKVAVSDGASESFDSKTWAKLLASRFVQDPELSVIWLADAVAAYLAQFDQARLSWSMQAAFERGSFATLLGVEHSIEHSIVKVFGVGDSIAVLLDDGEFVDSFPYISAEQFQKRPKLFCTKVRLNSCFSSPEFFLKHHKTWSMKGRKEPVVLCMTDALGEWALRSAQEGQPIWQTLSEIKNLSDLENLVFREREAKKMRIDDATLLKLSIETGGSNELPYS